MKQNIAIKGYINNVIAGNTIKARKSFNNLMAQKIEAQQRKVFDQMYDDINKGYKQDVTTQRNN